MTTSMLLKRSTALLALATALAAAPYQLTVTTHGGIVGLAPSQALARGGDDDGGSGGRGGDNGGNGGNGGDHGGGNDSSDDSGGNGGGQDDNSGSGGGHGGGQDDGGGRNDDNGGGNDDRGGNSGRGADDTGRDDNGGRRGADDSGRARGDDDAHEVTFSDGSRIEIENGRFEMKDASGRTIVERPATAADRALLDGTRNGMRPAGAAAGGSGIAAPPRNGNRGGGLVAEVEVSGENIEIRYTDGWKEEIENGRYQLKDELNRTVIERSARPSDRDRLFAAVQ